MGDEERDGTQGLGERGRAMPRPARQDYAALTEMSAAQRSGVKQKQKAENRKRSAQRRRVASAFWFLLSFSAFK